MQTSTRSSMRIPYNPENEKQAGRLTRAFSMSSQDGQDPAQALKGKLPPGTLGNYMKIMEIHDEMLGFLGKFNSKIGDTIQKEEAEIICAYEKKIIAAQKELDMIKDAYGKDEKEKFEAMKTAEMKRLEALTKKQHEDLEMLTEICERQKKEITRLTLLNEQLQKDQAGIDKRLKKSVKENKKLIIEISALKQKLAMSDISLSPTNLNTDLNNSSPNESKNLEISIELSPHNLKDKNTETLISLLKDKKYDKEQALFRCEEYLNKTCSRYENYISKLKSQLYSEKKQLQKIKTHQTYAIATRSELENLFLECVEEIRCKISHKNIVEGEFPEIDPYQLKKLPVLPAHEKIKIMETFMMNDKLLQVLYDAMFGTYKTEEKNIKTAQELPTLAPRSNSFYGNYMNNRKEASLRNNNNNKSFIDAKNSHLPEYSEKELPNFISGRPVMRSKSNMSVEKKLRKQIYNAPIHTITAKGKLMISKRNQGVQFKEKLYGKKVTQ